MDLNNLQIRYRSGGLLLEAVDMIDGVLIDPVDQPDSFTPISERPVDELLAWWRLPYVVTASGPVGGYDVRCLDGGANDRPISIGSASTLSEAVEIAKARRPHVYLAYVHVG